MNKTAISILQEYLVQQRRALPLYTDEVSDIPGSAFKCTVSFEDIKVSGYASTKKEAKQKSAQLALQKMGVIEKVCQEFNGTVSSSTNNNNNSSTNQMVSSTIVSKCLPNENYIGKLNELASTSGKPYACYQESIIPINGRFCVNCEFLKWKTEGYGSTKKAAKQDAAREMLEIVRTTDISIIDLPNDVSLHVDKLENINKLNDAMIKKYKELTCDESVVPKSQTFPPMPHLRSAISSLEELQNELHKNGHENSIVMFQRDPCVMMLKVKGSSCRVMGHGVTKKEAGEDLLKSAVIMFNSGFSFVNGW